MTRAGTDYNNNNIIIISSSAVNTYSVNARRCTSSPICVGVYPYMCVCVCVCVREKERARARERERARALVCVCMCAVRVRMHVCLPMHTEAQRNSSHSPVDFCPATRPLNHIFDFYGVVSNHSGVIPYNYRNILEMLSKLMK